MADVEPLDDLAGRVLDGIDVDWTAETSRAEPRARATVAELGVLAAIGRVHRTEPDADTRPSSLSSELLADPIGIGPLERWGHLHVFERIGSGASSVVYRASDPRLDREVALKILAVEPGGSRPASVIVDEGRLLAKVHHPNVATIFGAEQIDGRIGLWMELIRGRTLEECLARDGVFEPAAAIAIGVDICRAVSAVHAAGLVHRDIKAQNVMRSDDGRIVLTDFGTGRQMDDRSVSDLTGTPLYLAPEVFAGQPANERSDLYSVGVLLFHLLTGAYPVAGRTAGDVRRAHVRTERRRLVEVRSDLPAGLVRIVERLLERNPAARYASADAVARDLEAEQLSLGSSPRRRRLLLVAATTALVLALGWGLTRRDTAPASTVARPLAVAILPLTAVSTNPGSAEFAAGLTTEIVRQLAEVDGLAVQSAVAVARGARSGTDIRASLGVDYVVDGSVSHDGHRVRVSVRLARAGNNVEVWSDVVERGIDTPVPIQEELAALIANALRLSLGQARQRPRLPFDSNFLFVRAQGLLARRSPESVAQAIDLFDQVATRHADFAPALAALASATATLSRRDANEDMPPPDPRTRPFAERAVALDPSLPEAHAALGSAAARDREWALAEASFERALELGPQLTTVYSDFVLSTLLPLGRFDDALEHLRIARTRDPLSLDVRRVMALIEVDSGRYQDAILNAEWVLERDPAFPYAATWLGRALALSGRHTDALAVLSQNPGNWGYVGYTLAVSGRRAEAEALAAQHGDSPSREMLIYAGLGDRERTLAALERVAADNWWRAATWMRRPEMALLKGDKRLAAVAAKIGVPAY